MCNNNCKSKSLGKKNQACQNEVEKFLNKGNRKAKLATTLNLMEKTTRKTIIYRCLSLKKASDIQVE